MPYLLRKSMFCYIDKKRAASNNATRNYYLKYILFHYQF